MKLSKILLTAVAAVSVIGFASCGNQGNVGQKINKTNDSTEYAYLREWSKTTAKHFAATATITNTNPAEKLADKTYQGKDDDGNSINVVANAGLGFMFGLEQTSDEEIAGNKFYTFGIASVRYNQNTKKVQWYVSWVKGAPEQVFKSNNCSGFRTKLYLDDGTSGTYGEETQIVPAPGAGSWKDTTVSLTSDNELVVKIVVTANDDGSYTVELKDEKEETVYDTATISKDVTGFESKVQKYIGRYVTVYSGQTVQGSIKYKDIEGNVIPDYEEIVFDD